jgi:hypothetical protein
MGVSLKDVKPVAVLYHGYAIALGFDDLVWNQFFLPLLAMNATDERSIDAKKEFDTVVDPKKKGNPCLHKQGGDFDTSIESLIADAGARIFMCNHATEGVASGVARKLGEPRRRLQNDEHASRSQRDARSGRRLGGARRPRTSLHVPSDVAVGNATP